MFFCGMGLFGNTKKKKSKILRYQSPLADLGPRDFWLAEWYVRHKVWLRNAFIGFLLFVGIGLNAYGVYAWAEYLLVGYGEEVSLVFARVRSFPNFEQTKPFYQAKSLQISRVSSFPSTEGKIDFSAHVFNPNVRHVATIEYQFVFGSGATEPKTATILPGQEQPIFFLGYALEGPISSARLSLVSIHWDRVSPHDIVDVPRYIQDRLQVSVSQVSFVRKSMVADIPAHIVSFDIANDTAYGYWNGVFAVEFLDQDTPVGVTTVFLNPFPAQHTASVSLRLFQDPVTVTDVRVTPLMNPFHEEEFMVPSV